LVFSQRRFPKGDFPSDDFPSKNFPNVKCPKRQLPKDLAITSKAQHVSMEGGPSAAARKDLESWHLEEYPCEVARCSGKPLGKFLTSMKLLVQFFSPIEMV